MEGVKKKKGKAARAEAAPKPEEVSPPAPTKVPVEKKAAEKAPETGKPYEFEFIRNKIFINTSFSPFNVSF